MKASIHPSPKEILEALDTNAQGQVLSDVFSSQQAFLKPLVISPLLSLNCAEPHAFSLKAIPGVLVGFNQRACKLCKEVKKLPMAGWGQRREKAGELQEMN